MEGEFKISSSVFKEGEMIPSKYTADGANISPPLVWSGVPEGTKSLALINDDPDAPIGNWVHWLIKDIPPDTTEIKEGKTVGIEVKNNFGFVKYGGPAPPSGTHRYFFKLYAIPHPMLGANNIKQFYQNVEANNIGVAQIMGKYARLK